MGVPALFRWLSKKYPKIVETVVEDEPVTIQDADEEATEMPVDTSQPNPNGFEMDNLYLDMNGIVHPCTHPEGRPAPETEAEMMVEVFRYTERVVSMVRPRKMLFMAIDGVAPRAKMNQQRSRRFRSSQEAKEKEEERKEAVAMFEALGHTVSDETKNKKSWDSNAITPGTPFMDLLASSLRYWVAQKMNSDPGWKNLQVIISDSSVPGEGEHKIMDWIRRQRVHPSHDPNTSHVIYGLDADLIMLALATHEPHFRVLREDVFAQDPAKGCRICGQEGHYAAQCTGEKKFSLRNEAEDEPSKAKKPVEKKPFIFLDVAILREYLEIDLNVPGIPFPFDLELAIDDWIFLIFFVGNDFLPHLPSLEIREGAVDVLLKIWKDELPRMGGYLTNHGQVELHRAQFILDGLASRENDIFRKRREAEERQDQNAKRRKIEAQGRNPPGSGTATPSINGIEYVPVPAQTSTATLPRPPGLPSSLPARPSFDMFLKDDTASGAKASGNLPQQSNEDAKREGVRALGGSNSDVVNNRQAIRMANMSAAEALKAELAGLAPLGRKHKVSAPAVAPAEDVEAPGTGNGPIEVSTNDGEVAESTAVDYQNAMDTQAEFVEGTSEVSSQQELDNSEVQVDAYIDGEALPEDEIVQEPESILPLDTDIGTPIEPTDVSTLGGSVEVENAAPPETDAHGTKRKADALTVDSDGGEDAMEIEDEDEEGATPAIKARKVNPDGTVDQEDTVRLWEDGYQERYYRQKFGVELNDTAFRRKLTTHYIEGLSWVLHYYYQGTPSWNWFYPYHFAPFAGDFHDVESMNIKFNKGIPFKPFEQLMAVFPAASRVHLPQVYHPLMTEPNSPIIDFYPEEFEIDMNGKKMAWQGVALLPFIDEKRLLEAMIAGNASLTEEEKQRNKWGNNSLMISEHHTMYHFLCGLYTKRRNPEAIPIDTRVSGGISGAVLADPSCVPGSTYVSPLTDVGLLDITDDRSLSALYFYPRQETPHRSKLLPGVTKPKRKLTGSDQEWVRNGGGSRGRRGHGRDNAWSNVTSHRDGYGGGRGNGGGAYGAGGYSDRGSAPYRDRERDRDYHRPPPSNYSSRPPSSDSRFPTPPSRYPPPPVASYGGSAYGQGRNAHPNTGGQSGYGSSAAGYGGSGRGTYDTSSTNSSTTYGGYGYTNPSASTNPYGTYSASGAGGYTYGRAPPPPMPRNPPPPLANDAAYGGYGGMGGYPPSNGYSNPGTRGAGRGYGRGRGRGGRGDY